MLNTLPNDLFTNIVIRTDDETLMSLCLSCSTYNKRITLVRDSIQKLKPAEFNGWHAAWTFGDAIAECYHHDRFPTLCPIPTVLQEAAPYVDICSVKDLPLMFDAHNSMCRSIIDKERPTFVVSRAPGRDVLTSVRVKGSRCNIIIQIGGQTIVSHHNISEFLVPDADGYFELVDGFVHGGIPIFALTYHDTKVIFTCDEMEDAEMIVTSRPCSIDHSVFDWYSPNYTPFSSWSAAPSYKIAVRRFEFFEAEGNCLRCYGTWWPLAFLIKIYDESGRPVPDNAVRCITFKNHPYEDKNISADNVRCSLLRKSVRDKHQVDISDGGFYVPCNSNRCTSLDMWCSPSLILSFANGIDHTRYRCRLYTLEESTMRVINGMGALCRP